MTTHSESAHGTKKPRQFDLGWFLFQIGRVMLVGVLFLLFFLLAQDMVRHRFFQGGEFGRNGHVIQ
jgi:hypothetical protein